MAKDNDEFDVLSFFNFVMIILTIIVSGFAYILKTRVDEQSKKIVRELRNLNTLQDLAIDDKFKNWIQREREGKAQQGSSPEEFNARLVQSARRFRVKIDRLDPKPPIKRPGFVERPYSVTIKNGQLESVTRFLFDVEEKWVGAKVKQMQLNWREKNKAWSIEATVSIFETNTES